jgi:cytochrome b561
MPRWQERLARTTHVLLYVALIVQPLAGYLGSEVSGYPVKYFGMTLPSWAGKHIELKDALSGVHLVTSFVIAALVTLHVAGALKHALVDHDGLLARMGLGRARRSLDSSSATPSRAAR